MGHSGKFCFCFLFLFFAQDIRCDTKVPQQMRARCKVELQIRSLHLYSSLSAFYETSPLQHAASAAALRRWASLVSFTSLPTQNAVMKWKLIGFVTGKET